MINVIGGTYREIDYDEVSIEIYGSGYRGVKFLLENDCKVNFKTVGNKDVENYLNESKKVYENLTFDIITYPELITFKYSFALDNPTIFPNILNISKVNSINIVADNIIAFGMLDADYKIAGLKVIYDPQTSIKPNKFSDFGKAQELIYIVNKNEAVSIASSENIDEIRKYFFDIENVTAFIIKDGPFGATLHLPNGIVEIPSYITDNIYKIGSGDIFTSSFGYYWMKKKLTIEESAFYASQSTAMFCDKKAYIDTESFSTFDYEEFKPKNLQNKQVYLASPFFALSELILIDKIRSTFLSFGIKVFSPFHDVGIGNIEKIAHMDIEGINNSDIIFCLFDNYDSGTLIESGYSFAKQKKMIGYHRTCEEDKLLMLKTSDIEHYTHLTTAIYKTIWSL